MVTVLHVTPAEAAALKATWPSPIASTPTIHTPQGNNNNENRGENKRPLPSEDLISGREIMKRQKKADGFVLDLSDVPQQQPVPKTKGRIKEGASKYTGVSFNKMMNKWMAQILIEGKTRHIGYYENEEEAAIDYARAVFKYNGQGALDKARKMSGFAIDLSNVPPQLPILKSDWRIREGASKYAGVYFNKATNKWKAQISIEGNKRHIGLYENEEEAAIDYARAVFKYNGEEALVNNLREENSSRSGSGISIDLTDVPQQAPIPRSKRHIIEGSSKYAGVSFKKSRNKWEAFITIDGKSRFIGLYEDEEEAAINYARAVFKYKGQDALDKAMEQSSDDIDLIDVPPQLPILKSDWRIREGASKYAGVYFDKSAKKWSAKIMIEGKKRHIGCYDNEEEAAIDYVRAVSKYKGQWALLKARQLITSGSRLSNGLNNVAGSLKATESRSSSTASASIIQAPQGNNNANRGGNKHPLPSEDPISARETTKSQEKADGFVIDLSDVPQQQPVPQSQGHMEESSSKYTGVYFDDLLNRWQARIMTNGEDRHIGSYENEQDALAEYARAFSKCKGQEALEKAREVREDSMSYKETSVKRQKADTFILDLSDVPPQPPIPKSDGHMKEGASKYAGIYFNKQSNKWKAQISIDGNRRLIGYFENEEEAAIDYARAVLKYKGPGALDKAREQNSSGPASSIDLSDVPPQKAIPKIKGHVKEGASKYIGVSFDKTSNKWQVKIKFEGKKRHVGCYENEEEAAIDYARAVFKYKGQGALDKARKQISSGPAVDLTDVPPQQPIPKSKRYIKEGASRYAGVCFNKPMNKWQAQIRIEGKVRLIGCYVNEEEAAVDYARAVFKYNGQEALDKKRKRNSSGSEPAINIDLSDVPPQLPIPKRERHIKEGSSKYTGINFHKPMNKWKAEIKIDGKTRHIGYYENEEEAAIDYARAVFKYRGQEALNNLRERNSSAPSINLSDVPPQLPIPKSEGHIKEEASKYAGVSFDKSKNKWKAQITFDGKKRSIGCYENEEEAAIDYARAVFKYKGQDALDEVGKRNSSGNRFLIDLSDVPPQVPIPKSKGRKKDGASKYAGVSFLKSRNKWETKIWIEGKPHHIGLYEKEEEAAVDYARAVSKYKKHK